MVHIRSLHVDGNRLNLNWNEGELYCNNWNDDDRNDNIGVFPLMV